MKYLLQVFLVILISATSFAKSLEGRIENLKYECSTQENRIENSLHPWVTFIPLKTRTYNPGANVQCIGALISKRHVITTSTCLQFVVSDVVLGQGNDNEMLADMLGFPVKKWIVYDKADIALLKLANDAPFSDTVRPICLPFPEFKKPRNNTIFDVVSWTHKAGSMSISKKTMTSALTNCKKGSKYLTCLRSTGEDVACYGDEGSPIMYLDNQNWFLYGILYNVFDSDGSPCARNSPAVGLKITDDIVNWIVEKMD